MFVLVAIPYRHTTPQQFVDMATRNFGAMTFTPRQVAMYPNRYASDGRQYSPNAQARNDLIERCLMPQHTHVLWMDVDLVYVPANVIEFLAGVSEGHAVAPFPFVESIRPGEPNRDNGGWFYDTGGFVRSGVGAQEYAPHFPGYTGGVIELDSVGTCYLIPADVYRRGGRYDPRGDEVEHLSLFRRVRSMGYKCLATDQMRVVHAYLPKYGEKWHG